MNKIFSQLLAELIGTFLLVLICCGVAMTSNSVITIAAVFGLTIFFLILVLAPMGGAHFNPAVSLAMLIQKKIKFLPFLGNVAMQFIGAFLAGAALFYYAEARQITSSLGANGFAFTKGFFPHMATVAFVVEVLLSVAFVLTILIATRKGFKKVPTAAFIGAALFFVHLIGISITGTSVNPARSFGPAVFTFIGNNDEPFRQLWLFIVAPCVGAVLAVLADSFFRKIEN